MGMCAMYSFKYGPRPTEDGDDHGSPRSGTSSSDCSATPRARPGNRAGSQYDQHPALWKRTIPKGRRCEPLDFSGLILYDEHGNRLHHFAPPAYPRHEEVGAA